MAQILEFNEIFYNNFEPKVQNRFYMEFSEVGIPSYIVKAASRPSINFNKITMHHINVKRYLKGAGEWQDLTVTLYDPIVPSGAQAVMNWVRLSHESITGRDGYADMYKKDLTFYSIGPVGDKIEEWKLKGAFITQAQFGDMDWENDTPVNITLTLAYDYAILEY
jgi:hypothetical protein